MKRVLMFLFVFFICSFYSYILYLSVHPNVNKTYDFYFIQHKLYTWNNGEALDYKLSVPLKINKTKMSNFSTKGWRIFREFPNGICTNVKFTQPHLYFKVDKNQKPKKLIFTGTPLLLASPLSNIQQTLEFYLNNKLIYQEDFPNLKTVSIDIPKSFLESEILDFEVRYNGPGYNKTRFGKKIGFCFTEIILK